MDIVEKICLIILPVLLTALIGSIIWRKQKEKELFDRLYDVFHSAFATELAFLVSDIKSHSSIHGTAYDVLTKSLNKHRHAVDVFGRELNKRKRERFDETWNNYLYPNGYNKDADFPLLDYAEGDDFEKRKLAHSKISKLLEVAKPK